MNSKIINRCAGVVPRWDKYWHRAVNKQREKGSKRSVSIISTLCYTFGPAFSVSGVYQLAFSILQFANPQVPTTLKGH